MPPHAAHPAAHRRRAGRPVAGRRLPTTGGHRGGPVVKEADVIIQGAGASALATAVGLARGGLAVTLLDAAEVCAAPAPGSEPRHSVIDIVSERVLRHLGGWPFITRDRTYPIEALELEDCNAAAHLTLSACEVGETRLGHVVERGVIDRALRELFDALPQTRRLATGPVRDIAADRQRLTIHLEDGQALTARLLVAADGDNSPLRRLAGIRWRRAGYGQDAVIARIRTERPPGHTVRQRFCGDEPLTLLPLDEHESALLWPVPRTRARRLLEADSSSFHHQLEIASGAVLGGIEASSARQAQRLIRGRAERYIGPRLALVGNAAHTVHPLAAQAVNLSLLDAATLIECVLEAHSAGRDPGGIGPLRRYERRRRGSNARMQNGLDITQWLFGAQAAPLPLLRGTGLRIAARLPPLRQALMTGLMGLHGDLPELARGPGV
nr:FAD-dependent monooxygenase [Halorhodospira sp. 9621]